jgi:chromosomal replication initiation ATPase DnaA
MPSVDQLPLPFAHRERYLPDTFWAAPANEEARAWLDRTSEWPDGRLALWGEAGSGKTHLLHIWADRLGATLLDGRTLRGLADLPSTGGIAVDDADTAEQAALFHLLNAAGEAGLPVLLAARAVPSRWPTTLPDLQTRLRAIVAVGIGRPDDAQLRLLLAKLFADRGIEVAESVQSWLLLRLPRSPAALREAVVRLDQAALARGSAVTRALAAEMLADLLASEELEKKE